MGNLLNAIANIYYQAYMTTLIEESIRRYQIGITISIIVYSIMFAIFCGIVAKSKNRNIKGWVLLGFFFGIFSLIVLMCLKKYIETKLCPCCSQEIPKPARICPFCKTNLNDNIENTNNPHNEIKNTKTISLADKIREFIIKEKIIYARKLKLKTIEISARDIHESMELENRFPAVCEVLSGEKFLKTANLKIINESGSNPSTIYSVVYEIL